MLITGWHIGWASANTVQALPELTTLPWLQILVGVFIASWGGATATLGRYLAAEYESRPFHWPIETLRDLAVSVTVGGGAYMAGAWYGLNPMLLGLVLLLSGYLGSRALDASGKRLLAFIRNSDERTN
jgi:hypothetical protein